MSSTRRITALTRQGLASLQKGRHMDSILRFRHALDCLKKATYEGVQGMTEEHQSCQKDAPLELARLPLNNSSPQEHVMVHPLSPHNVFDIYNCGYVPVSPQGTPLTLESCHVADLSAVLLYNLGLAHHLAGLYSGRNAYEDCVGFCNQEHLVQSQSYYKLSLTCLQKSSITTSSNSSTNWYALALAVLNNLGFLFVHFFQVDEARAAGRHLDKLLNEAASSHSIWEEDQGKGVLDFFYGALTQEHKLTVDLAPAA